MSDAYQPKPEWLKIQLNGSPAFHQVRESLQKSRLNTVCEEARCPNLHECWGKHKTATFMILGDTCTRRCRFCNVKTGLPKVLDLDEPRRVAEAAAEMGLKHVVVTMVNRDDLEDGGAAILAQTVEALHQVLPDAGVEVLSSDLMGKPESIATLVASKPEILSHNLETVRRLTPLVRSRSDYDRSLDFLKQCKDLDPEATVKSSLMLGLGETFEEVLESMDDLRKHGVDVLNMGQYLQPSRTHIPVARYWSPEEFAQLKVQALSRGFRHVEAAPLVRSSYHAGGQYEQYRKRIHPLYQES